MVTTNVDEAWQAGVPHEIAFWEAVISGKHPKEAIRQEFANRRDGLGQFPRPLTKYLRRGVVNRILDVGSGPISSISPNISGFEIEIVAIDPLADQYNDLMAKHRVGPKIPTISGQAEDLSRYVGQFDLVHSRNALDHSRAPLHGLREMCRACKPGGAVWLAGHSNEALCTNYKGLHQWNFMPVDSGDLVVWRENDFRSVRKLLADATVTACGSVWYEVEIRPKPATGR